MRGRRRIARQATVCNPSPPGCAPPQPPKPGNSPEYDARQHAYASIISSSATWQAQSYCAYNQHHPKRRSLEAACQGRHQQCRRSSTTPIGTSRRGLRQARLRHCIRIPRSSWRTCRVACWTSCPCHEEPRCSIHSVAARRWWSANGVACLPSASTSTRSPALISQVKTSPLACGLADSAAAVVAQAAGRKRAKVPDLPRLDHWFTPEVQLALASLTTAIATAPPDHRDALRLALSSIVVRVSNQESDTRYAAICKNVRAADAFAGRSGPMPSACECLGERRWIPAPSGSHSPLPILRQHA